MPEQDYILRYLELFGRFLAQALDARKAGKPDEALQILVQAQEQLFGRPMAEFSGLGAEEQLGLLRAGETVESARGKQVAYASLLREAGLAYHDRGREDLAAQAFQFSLWILLTVAVAAPETADELLPSIRELLSRLAPEQLYDPTKELLRKLGQGPTAASHSN